MNLLNKIRNLIKRSEVTLVSVDNTDTPTLQCQYFNDASNAEYIYHYGAHGVPPLKSIGLMFNVNAYAESKAGIYYNREMRPKGLQPGEFATGNFQEKSFTTYYNDGTITVVSKTGAVVIMDDAGDILWSNSAGSSIAVSGDDISLSNSSGTSITISGDDIILDGNVIMTKDLQVDGPSITSANIQVGSTHNHNYNPGPGSPTPTTAPNP